MNVSSSGRLLWVVGMSLALAGCGSADNAAERYSVTGTVTFDGQPIPEGQIIFFPADDLGGRPDAGPIKDGRYELKAIVGSKRVEIQATRENPERMVNSTVNPGKKEPIHESYIPTKYNSESELKAEVTADGENSFDFSLEPGPVRTGP